MLRVPWVHRVTNDVILYTVAKEKQVRNTIKRRNIAHLEHIVRNENYCSLYNYTKQSKKKLKLLVAKYQTIDWFGANTVFQTFSQ